MRLLRRPRLSRPPLLDAAVAGLLLAAGQFAIWTGATQEGPRTITVWTAILLTAPLAWRRTAPTTAAVVYIAGGSAQAVLADAPSSIWSLAALLLMAFSVGMSIPGRRGARVGIGLVAFVWVSVLLQPDSQLGDKLFTAPLLAGGPVLAGVALRRQRARAERMTRLAVELERDREETARQAVAAERARIARELHDVVAHAVSVMIVQAGAAEELMGKDPDRARGALGTVRDCGKQSLGELRRLLGVIRSDVDDPAALAPQPGLRDLDALMTTMREGGQVVDVEAAGAPYDLPPGLDLTAYRVVQESLTNVRKHARCWTRAMVTLRYEPLTLTITVRDDGRGDGTEPLVPATGPLDGGGQGLVGMRERVALYGGTLRTGPEARSGWCVEAVLTVPGATTVAAP